MTEEWRPVVGYEGLYEVSNLGNVRSINRTMTYESGTRSLKQKTLAKQENSKGYYRVYLISEDGVRSHCFVHRLVAEAFLGNHEGLDTVNHKDFNIHNNCVDNLEWTTKYGNFKYSFDRGRFAYTESRRKKLKRSLRKKLSKPVISIDLWTGERRKFDTVNSTAEYGFQPSCVSNCCNGIRLSHGGYVWMFAEEAKRGS